MLTYLVYLSPVENGSSVLIQIKVMTTYFEQTFVTV